jgi:hypothetical protein
MSAIISRRRVLSWWHGGAKAKYVTGLVRHGGAEGRASSDHLHAVRAGAASRGCAAAGGERPFTHEVLVRPTGFMPGGEPEEDKRMEFQRLCDAVMKSPSRNAQIIAEVLASGEGRSLARGAHGAHGASGGHCCRTACVGESAPHVITLQGGMGRKALAAVLDQLKAIPANESRVVVATGRFLGEGFDDARLDTLFLTMPVSWRGTIAQYAGRCTGCMTARRWCRSMTMPISMCRCSHACSINAARATKRSATRFCCLRAPCPAGRRRCAACRSAVEADYAASVRRLIRDGIDTPLAQLFVHATRLPAADAVGAERARSASEAFIFRRFETVASSRANSGSTHAADPFDDRGRWRSICSVRSEARHRDRWRHSISEIPSAYRRDRRKDALLQTHGYFVLRFLADDLGKEPGIRCLDTVLRAMVGRSREILNTVEVRIGRIDTDEMKILKLDGAV